MALIYHMYSKNGIFPHLISVPCAIKPSITYKNAEAFEKGHKFCCIMTVCQCRAFHTLLNSQQQNIGHAK